MRFLFVHTNYPAQFRRLAPALAKQGHEVVFLARTREWHAPPAQGIRLKVFEPHRSGGSAHLHPYLRRFDEAVLLGQAAYRACRELAAEGWEPDWIINHVGFGCGFYLNDAFPQAKRAGLFEWYYNAFGSDVDFLRRGNVEPDRQLRLRTWNAQTLLELAAVDVAVTPTHWQQQQFPIQQRQQLKVIHEGIDWHYLNGLRKQPTSRPSCLASAGSCEVATYVSRGFEDYRGFPQAMQALAELQRRRPQLHVLIAGSDVVAYGAGRSDGRSWGTWAKEDAGLDPARTHWLGALQDAEYHQLLVCSDVHLYLTVPFVLSWSLLEAMASGCSIVASDTAPVREVISHEREGLLVDFFDPIAQADAMETLLEHPELGKTLGIAASQKSQHYDFEHGLESWLTALSRSPDRSGKPTCQPVR